MKQKKLTFKWLDAGYCVHPEFIAKKGGRLKLIEFPAFFAVIEDPQIGIILYDTGYNQMFLDETKRFPNKLYSTITPVTYKSGNSAKEQLEKMGKKPDDVKIIIISHFHADHISGLKDFPNAQYVYSKKEWDSLKNLKGFKALRNAFLPNLIPDDFKERSIYFEDLQSTSHTKSLQEFNQVKKITKDSSILLVPLPGHTVGQIGIYFTLNKSKDIFIVADATWASQSIKENLKPHFIAMKFTKEKKRYIETLTKLHNIYNNFKNVEMLPSHCIENKGIYL